MGALAMMAASSAFAQADGDYYLLEPSTGNFLARGANYGTRAVTDRYGIPFTWNRAEGTINFKDNGLRLFDAGGNNIYTDNTNSSTGWKFTEVEGGYNLQFADNRYVGYEENTNNLVFVESEAQAIVWQLLTKDQRDKFILDYETKNFDNIIAKAGLNVTSAEFLNTINSDTYAQKDLTDKMGTATFNESIGAWTWNQVRGEDKQPAYGTNFCEVYQATGSYTQTVSGLPEGIYKVTMKGLERNGWNDKCTTLGDAGYEISTATLEANGASTLFASWYSGQTGGNNPNNTSQAVAKFNEGKYNNTVYTYVGADGTMDLKINIPQHVGGHWVIFNDFKLTLYTDQVSTEDAAALLESVPTGKMQQSISEALSDAKAAFEANQSIANYNKLSAIIPDAKASVEAYAAANAAISEAKSILEKNNVVTKEAKATFEALVNDYDAKYTAGTLTTPEASGAGKELGTVRYEWNGRTWGAALTFIESAWDATDKENHWSGAKFYANNWSKEGESDGTGFLVPFIEAFNDRTGIAACTATATVDVEPNKMYSVSIWSRYQKLDKNGDVDANGITLTVGNGNPTDLTRCLLNTNSNLYVGEFTASGKSDENGKLTIKVDISSGNLKWVSFKNVSYGDYVPTETTSTLNFNTSELEAADITEEVQYQAGENDITVTPSFARTTSAITSTANGPQLRVYGGYVKVVAPKGKTIKAVSMNTSKWSDRNTFNGVAAPTADWKGDNTNVYLAVAANTQINSITVTTSDETDNTETYVPEMNDLLSAKRLPLNSEVKIQLTGTKVTLEDKANYLNYAFLEDATDAARVDYGITKLDNIKVGHLLEGTLYASVGNLKGIRVLVANDNTANSDFTATEVEIEPTDATLADCNTTAVAFKYVSLSDLTVKKVAGEYGTDVYLVSGDTEMLVIDSNFGLLTDPISNRIRDYENISKLTGFVNVNYTGKLYFMPYGTIEATVAPTPKAANIGALKAMLNGSNAELTLTDAKVTVYMPSIWNMYPTVFIEDATGAVQLDGELATDVLGITGGNTIINGTLVCNYTDEYGMKVIMPNENTNAKNITLTEGVVEPTAQTVAELSTVNHEFEYVKVEGAELIIDENWNTFIAQGENRMMLYDSYWLLNYSEDEPGFNYGEIDYVVGYTIIYETEEAEEGGEAVVTYAFVPLEVVEKKTPTAINDAILKNSLEGDVYTVNGVKVRKAGQNLNGLSKGMYIMNGKKVILK